MCKSKMNAFGYIVEEFGDETRVSITIYRPTYVDSIKFFYLIEKC